jgi:hypothetical protein
MRYLVLAAWLVQAAVGLALLAAWIARDRRSIVVVAPHVGLAVTALGLWVVFIATDRVGWGWSAFAIVTVGNGLGDYLLVGRSRQLIGTRSSLARDWARAVGVTFAGRLPGRVTFHALFSGVVYFAALAACIIASSS